MKRRTLSLAPITLAADVVPSTLNAEERTVELRWYTGATVRQVDLFDGPFNLSLDMSPKAVRLETLASGSAPLKGGHRSNNDIAGVFGVVEHAWLAKDGGRARVRFSRRAEVEPYFQDVKDGILRSVSMEARIHALEDRTKKGAEMQHLHATDWEPTAIALVALGADPAAQIALAEAERHPCRVTDGGSDMRYKKCPTCSTKLADALDATTCPNEDCNADLVALAAEAEETKRVSRLTKTARFYGVSETTLARALRDGTDPEAFAELAEAERSRTSPRPTDDRIGFGTDHDSPGARADQMAAALVARATRKEPTDAGRRYFGERLVDLAFAMLKPTGHARGLDPRHHGERLVSLALHTTSDFPLLLANVMNKLLLPGYENARPTFSLIAARRSFRDFRPHHFLRSGDFPVPLEVGEHGEIQFGTMSESDVTVSVLTYGRIFGLSRQVLVNDDVGAFGMLAQAAAQRVADFHNSTFYSLCIAPAAGLGPDMSDSNPVYDAAHSNVASAGALDVARLAESRQLLMQQTSLDGLRLNLPAAILLVSPESQTLAEQLVAPLSPAQVSNVNPFQGRLTVLADANLTGTRFYVMADPSRLAQYVYGFLEDVPLRVETRAGFETEGLDVKVVTDLAVGVVESRAGVSGAGS